MHKVPHAVQPAIVRLLHFKMMEREGVILERIFLEISPVLMNLQERYYSILTFFWDLEDPFRINPKIQCLVQELKSVLVLHTIQVEILNLISVWKYKARRHFLCSPWCLSKDNEVVESPFKKGRRHVDVVLRAMV